MISHATNLEVNSFHLPVDIDFTINLFLFSFSLQFNSLSLQLFIGEIIFMLDMIINFVTIREEDVKKYAKHINDVSITAKSYYIDGFWFDFIIWFPFGPLLARLVHPDLHVLSFIKCFRIVEIQKYLND